MKALKCMDLNKISVTDTARYFSISRKSLYNWINCDNLDRSAIRKRKITAEIKCYIRAYVIARISFEYKLLIKAIKRKFKISIGKSSIYNALKEMHISRKMINNKIIYTNKRKRNQQIKAFIKNIKKINIKDIISLDETSIDSHISNTYGWGLIGKKITIHKKHNRIRYTVTCKITHDKIFHIQIVKKSANANTFLEFIKTIADKLNKDKITYILLDNARIHHSKIVKAYVQTIDHIKFIYNVPYSPEYNPIEKVFGEAKRLIKNNQITNQNIIQKIISGFKRINQKSFINYYNKCLLFQ